VSDRSTLAERFHAFSDEAAGIGSPLYAVLSKHVAGHTAMLELVVGSLRPGQPPGNLFFAAVHDLLMRDPSVPLARYYGTLTPEPLPAVGCWPSFEAFVEAKQHEIAQLLAMRLVQTNEVRRCGYVAQACAYTAHEIGDDAPLALIEIGSSIGINLAWDQYTYTYRQQDALHGSATTVVNPGSTVALDIEWRGVAPTTTLPAVASRTGIDLNVLDARDTADRRWLRALIWPEHRERLALLDAALDQVAAASPALLEGDAADCLAQAIDAAPHDATVLIYHTHVFNQLNDAQRAGIHAQMRRAATQRPLYRFGNELLPGDGHTYPVIWQRWASTSVETRHLANVYGHGRWVQWLLPFPNPAGA
jgi:hypothetical protein